MGEIACRVCLATDTRLERLDEKNVLTAFENFIGLKIDLDNGLPKHICRLCKARMLQFVEFKKWCQDVQSQLATKMAELSEIPKDFMLDINKSFPKHNLVVVDTFNFSLGSSKEINEFQDQNSLIQKSLCNKEEYLKNIMADNVTEIEEFPLRKKSVIKHTHQVKIEDNNFDDFNVINDENIIEDYGTEITTVKSDRKLSKKYLTSKVALEDLQKIKLESPDESKKESFLEFESNKNLCNIESKEPSKKISVKSKSEDITNVKRKYKNKNKKVVAKTNPKTRKYDEWLESLRLTSEEHLEKYNIKINKVATKDEQMAKILARKETPKYKTSLFKCELCCKGYMSEKAYNSHNLLHQPSSKRPVKCDLCHVYLGVRSMKAHELRHRTELVCTRCGEHVDASKVKSHFDFHAGVKFECKECQKIFYHNSTYRNHVRIHHADSVCTICGALYNGRAGVDVHVMKSHAQVPCEQCEACRHYFCSKEALHQHRHCCSGDTSPCGWCGHPYHTIQTLREHIETEHSVNTTAQYFCTECDRPFGNELNLAGHWRRVHHDRPRGAKPAPKTVAGEKEKKSNKIRPVICDQCGKSVLSNYLPMHKLRHTGEKPHECRVCHKRFRVKQSLGIHMMIHSGEKPFKCSQCDTQFRQSTHLANHMRIHTGERPFVCEVCHKGFILKVNKEEHVRTVHEGLPPRRKKRDKKQTAE